MIFKLGKYKKGWEKALNYLFTGNMEEKWGPGAPWYVLSGEAFCLPFHRGLACLQSASMNGSLREEKRFFRGVLLKLLAE